MSFDLSVVRSSLNLGVAETRALVYSEQPPPREPEYQEAVASAVSGPGWSRFQMDLEDVAAALGITPENAADRFVQIELNLDEPPLQVEVMPYGVSVNAPWREGSSLIDPLWLVIQRVFSVEPAVIFDPQTNRILQGTKEAVLEAYEASAQWLRSPSAAKQIVTALEELRTGHRSQIDR
jgi:hypothetical protein